MTPAGSPTAALVAALPPAGGGWALRAPLYGKQRSQRASLAMNQTASWRAFVSASFISVPPLTIYVSFGRNCNYQLSLQALRSPNPQYLQSLAEALAGE